MRQRLLAWPIAAALRVLGATWRLRIVGPDAFGDGKGLLGAMWHSDALIAAWHYRDRGVTVPVSFSRDGQLFDAALMHLGYARSARGSTSRGAMSLARQLIRATRAGGPVAVLPDGPRGPAGHAQAGIIAVAGAAGVPIVPVGFRARPAWRAHSWDRTRIPLPFARIVCGYGEPLHVPKRSSDAEREASRKELERRLDALGAELEGHMGRPG